MYYFFFLLLRDKKPYIDLGADYFDKLDTLTSSVTMCIS
jgi:hypothetical protein